LSLPQARCQQPASQRVVRHDQALLRQLLARKRRPKVQITTLVFRLTPLFAPPAAELDAHSNATTAPPPSGPALPGSHRTTPSTDPVPVDSSRSVRLPRRSSSQVLPALRQKGLFYLQRKSGHFYCVKRGHFYCNTTGLWRSSCPDHPRPLTLGRGRSLCHPGRVASPTAVSRGLYRAGGQNSNHQRPGCHPAREEKL
jgi:hypothetical protein